MLVILVRVWVNLHVVHRVVHDARVAVMAGVNLGTFERNSTCAADMKTVQCQRQSELGFIANRLGISNRWVWVRLYNNHEHNFKRPSTPEVSGTSECMRVH